MARPKLIKKGNTWYRNGKAVQAGYKYYDMNSKQWKILGKNGNFNTYKLGVRTSVVIPSPDSLTIQYAKHDLAPKVTFLSDNRNVGRDNVPTYAYDVSGTEAARQTNARVNDGFYSEVNDSIAKRIAQGYYDKYPEQYARDIQMRDQYKNNRTRPGGWSCINSVYGLMGNQTQATNKGFTDNANYRYYNQTAIPLNSSNAGDIVNTMAPGSTYQTPGAHHMVMYVGNNHIGDRMWYNTHGWTQPFKNGDQLQFDSDADEEALDKGYTINYKDPLGHGYINYSRQYFGEDFTDPYPGYIFTKNK